jgi:hypothetical protein
MEPRGQDLYNLDTPEPSPSAGLYIEQGLG